MTESEKTKTLLLAGAVGLLCECSLQLRPGGENDELRDNIERCVTDWCQSNGWTYQRVLHRIEVFPPMVPA